MGSPDQSSDFIPPAIATLLVTVARAADDLRLFHDTIAKADIDSAPPFPRTAVAAVSRVLNNLKHVEQDLREILIALGLPKTP